MNEYVDNTRNQDAVHLVPVFVTYSFSSRTLRALHSCKRAMKHADENNKPLAATNSTLEHRWRSEKRPTRNGFIGTRHDRPLGMIVCLFGL